MNRYLGFIRCNYMDYYDLSEFIELPFYGGVRLTYDDENLCLDMLVNYEKCAGADLIVVDFSAEFSDIVNGRVTSPLYVLDVVSSVEEAAQQYCEIYDGYLYLKREYCADVAPARMWAGTATMSSNGTKYVTDYTECHMTFSKHMNITEDYPYIITAVPMQVIESRGVPVIGSGWILEVAEVLATHGSFLKRRGLYTQPGLVLTEKAYQRLTGLL